MSICAWEYGIRVGGGGWGKVLATYFKHDETVLRYKICL